MVEVHLLQFGYPVIMITFTEKKFSLNCFDLFVRIFYLKVLCGNLCCWSSLPSTIHFLDYWSIVAWLKAIKIVLRFCTFFQVCSILNLLISIHILNNLQRLSNLYLGYVQLSNLESSCIYTVEFSNLFTFLFWMFIYI